MEQHLRDRVLAALREQRQNFGGSAAQFAVSLDINPAQLSRLMKGDTEGVVSAQKWEHLAHVLGVERDNTWRAARTQVYEYVTQQLEECQRSSMCAILVDRAGVGKTFAATIYKRSHRNVVYVDCSQAKARRKLLRTIARQLGIDTAKTYDMLYDAVVYALNTAFERPLVILDEMGDLKRESILEVKALWNATQYRCAWYAMGADGLKKRIDTAISNEVVGFVELFSRFGGQYNHATPEDDASAMQYLSKDCAAIVKLNADTSINAAQLIRRCKANPRMIYNELQFAQ